MENVIVGFVSARGYLYCTTCHPMPDTGDTTVRSDASPHNTEECDTCGRTLVRNWYVIPYVITDEDDCGTQYIALVAAPTRGKACERFESLALDGDETLWGKAIADAYDGSSFERSDDGYVYNCRVCDCGESECANNPDAHNSLSVALTWNTLVPVTECSSLDAARTAAQQECPYVTTDVFE